MKFQLTFALAAVCVANAGKIRDQAEAFAAKASDQNPISPRNQAKLEQVAKQEINKYTKLAQSEGAKYGIDFDLNAVYASLEKQYGKKVQSAVQEAAVKAESLAKNGQADIKNNQNIAEAQKLANSATFGSVLNRIQNALKDQVKNIPNQQVKNSLNSIVNQGAAEAKKAMKANKLGLNKNIKKTITTKGQKFVKGNKAQWQKKAAAQKKNINKQISQNL